MLTSLQRFLPVIQASLLWWESRRKLDHYRLGLSRVQCCLFGLLVSLCLVVPRQGWVCILWCFFGSFLYLLPRWQPCCYLLVLVFWVLIVWFGFNNIILFIKKLYIKFWQFSLSIRRNKGVKAICFFSRIPKPNNAIHVRFKLIYIQTTPFIYHLKD